MSITLPIVNLTGLVTGNTGSILLSNLGMSANPSLVQKNATLRFHNDSGTGLLISFKLTSGAFYLPAGGWADVEINPAESEIDYQVTYVLTGAQLTLLQITYYAPNENVPPMTNLGNSPIGISGNVNVSTAQSLDNEGNIASTQWLKVIQSGGPASNFAATVDGNFQIEQWDGATLKNLFHTIPNAGVGNSSLDLLVSGLFARMLGNLALANAVPLQSFDNAGNRRNILQVDANNNLQLFTISGLDILQLLNAAGTVKASFDNVNGLLNMSGTKQTINGSTSGTMDIYEFLSGAIKLVIGVQTNFQQGAASINTVTLKTAFTTVAFILNFGSGGVVTANGGVADTNRQITWGLSSGAGGSQGNVTQIAQDSAGFTVGGFTAVGSAPSYASAHGGITAWFGV